MESILTSIKKLLGIDEAYEQFDTDIVIHINSVLFALMQLGVVPEDGFSISDATATWNDFLDNEKNIEAVKTYVYLRVKLLFDPPLSTAVIESYNSQIKELEWRLNVAVDTGSQEGIKNEE